MGFTVGLTTLAANEGSHRDFVLFCFQSVFQKSEGKLCSGFANSDCFPFILILTIDLLTVVKKYKYFCFRVRMFHLLALHANH